MRKLAALLSAFAALTIFMVAVRPAYADVNDFVVTGFDADYTLSDADKQGTLHIIERISVNFHDHNHGILRAIPKSYNGHLLQLKVNHVSSDSGASSKFTTYADHGNTVIKIGSPDRTVTGAQEYTIDYTVNNVISFFGDHDELNWNINGDQWGQPFTEVRMQLHLPDGLQLGGSEPVCYDGAYGERSGKCYIDTTDARDATAGKNIAADVFDLGPHQTLTTVVGFQKGYFTPSTPLETFRERAAGWLEFFVPFLLIGGFEAVRWWRRGRDPKGRGVIVPEFGPPDELLPIEAGTLIDFKTDNRDLTATIVSLAVRRYVKIIEQTVNRKLLPDKKQYLLELSNADFTGLHAYETTLLDALFGERTAGKQVDLSSLQTKLSKTASDIRSAVAINMTNAGYFTSKPSLTGWAGFWAVLYCVIWLSDLAFKSFHVPFWVVAGVVCGTVVSFMFAQFMPSRSQKGVAAKEHILGLKMYLEVAEKDRLQMLQSPNAPYTPASSAPQQTVELFEKLLPYAVALGVETEWAKQFEAIYTTPPDWYGGNWATFNAVYLSTSLNDSLGAIGNTFEAPRSGSGGGFAGGGGGGGGGGGW